MKTADEIIDVLDSVRNLPTLPIVMQKLSSVIHDPNSDARTVARLIEDDPAITARILKVVNSSLYAGGVEIDSVSQAVARLGMNATNNVALSTSIFSAFKDPSGTSFDRNAFWKHSICVGIAACVVHAHAKPNLKKRHTNETLRLVGLLHDIGKLIMDQFMSEDFEAALRMAREQGMPLISAEFETAGIDHATLGGWLCAKWHMNEETMQPLLWHHDPDSGPPEHWEVAALCHMANYICNREQIGDGGDLAEPVCVQSVWKRLGLTVHDISTIVDEVHEEAKKSDILMSLI